MITKDLITLQIKSEGVDKVTIDLDKLAKGIKEIELEAKDAKAGIRGLKDENKALKEQNEENVRLIKQFSTELKQLQQQGQGASNRAKQLSQNVQKLNRDIDNNTTQIDKNNASINTLQNASEALIRTMKIEDMTMNQLSRRAEYLRARLGNISKSAEPEKWKKFNDQLIATEDQMKKVSIGGEQVKNRLSQLGKAAQEAGKTIGKVFLLMAAYSALRFFQDLAAKTREWVTEAKELAAKAEGVSRAFESLDKPKLLDHLREQTRGLIGDFELMQAAVKADKYKIPVDEVGNLLEFASRRAIDMGQDVDDFQKRIINGIGKQSKLILDDLGFSSVEINKAIAKQGSFAKGVISLVNEELEKQGPRALTAADMAVQASVKWQNAQLKVGNQFLWIDKLWSKLSGKIAGWVADFAERQLPDIMNKLINLYNHFVTAYNGSELLRASVYGIAYGFKLLFNNMKLVFDFGINQAILLGKSLNAALNPSLDSLQDAALAQLQYATRNFKAYEDYLASVKKDTEDFAKSIKGSKLDYITPVSGETINNTGGGPIVEEDKKALQKQKKELAARLENLENAHKDELLALKKYAFENNQTEEELKDATLKSDYKYYADRMQLVGDFLEEFKIKDKKFLADIGKIQADTRNSQFDLLPQFDANTLSELERQRDKSIQVIENWFELEKKALAERNLTKTQYDAEYELLELARTETVLAILKKYGVNVEAAEIQNGRIKAEALRKANEEIIKQEEKAVSDRNALNLNRSERNYDIRSSYGLVSQGENKNREKRALQAELMAGVIDYETYQKALSVLNKKYEDERLQVKEQYGLATVGELYNMELENLRLQHEQGLLSEAEFEEAKFRLKMEYGAKWVEEQKHWQEKASNLVSALMEAETAKLDAEYDVRIAAAEGNTEETERLEKEKAQKKLDIEKKYADVQFAVKASEIIANTAVAIMTGYAQLGPIAGTVAAVMLGATGAAQLIAANAERQKVKNLTLGGSSDSSAKYDRVVTPGKETGGYIDVEREQDGKPFTALYDPEKRGYVDSPTVIVGEGPAGRNREWVAGNALVENPTARPIIDLMDKAQTSGHASTIDMNRLIRARMAGFETGGFIAKPTGIVNTTRQSNAANTGGQDALASVLGEVRTLLAYLSANKIQASVNYQEFKDVESKMTDYQNFGNKH
ncbi:MULTISPECIES: hypothetical protein [unclassified Dysgonomonas]|uniref:hypothetical protein n=1 Tax=unclassified Dysgonomonas TaxID=2630389 RepID=UPI0025BE5F03|nr:MULTISPECIES: hypothetical protein [unclassified Dysgonomonas]HMM02049.1 hypothetical protein [Dysgonomonas sp.]